MVPLSHHNKENLTFVCKCNLLVHYDQTEVGFFRGDICNFTKFDNFADLIWNTYGNITIISSITFLINMSQVIFIYTIFDNFTIFNLTRLSYVPKETLYVIGIVMYTMIILMCLLIC